ncbi:MAG TPA: methyltransferase domain-containing protein [Actinomycetota bacterium]|nr:methyltransferase domain-containing protein [Actinomycetota bacterium]
MERPTELPSGTPRAEVVADLVDAFSDHGVPALLVRAPGVDAGSAGLVGEGPWRHDIDVIVPRQRRTAAGDAVDALDWRLSLGGSALWRHAPTVSYHWDYGPDLFLHRGVPAGPLPSRALDPLARALSSSAAPHGGIRVPDAATLAVFAATQAARPTPHRALWLGDFRVHLAASEPGTVERLARRLGLSAAVRWAQGDAAERLPVHLGGPLFDGGATALAWRTALLLRRFARPQRLRRRLGGVPTPGDAIARSRFAGLEFQAGPGAFIPQPVSEPMVELASEGLTGSGGVVVDVGTGVGAVALAVASRHPGAEVHGCDVSADGLRWAARNRRRLGLERVTFHRGSLLEPVLPLLEGRVDVLTVNVPYVPPWALGRDYRDRDGTVLGRADDGLGLHRELLAQAAAVLAPGGRLIVQLAIDQWELFAPSMASWGIAPRPLAAASFEDAVCWGVAEAFRGTASRGV